LRALPLVLVLPAGCGGGVERPVKTAVGPIAPGCAAASTRAGWRPPMVRRAGDAVAFDAFIGQLAEQPVVFIGERHDRYADHLLELEIICRLHQRNPDVAIGMEVFQRPYQQALDDYVAGRAGTSELLERSEYYQRWRFDYRLYAPILAYARDQGIPVVALNVPTEITRKVARHGIGSLSAAERTRVPARIEAADSAYRARLYRVFTQHPGFKRRNFGYFLDSQLLWDEGMAASAARYTKAHPGRRLIVIVGGGHLAPGAIPERYARRTGEVGAIVVPRRMAGAQDTVYAYTGHPLSLPEPGRLGIVLKSVKDRVVAEAFADDSAAREAGVAKGDRLLSVNGRRVKGIADIRIALWDQRPGDTVSIRVGRATGGEENYRVTLR